MMGEGDGDEVRRSTAISGGSRRQTGCSKEHTTAVIEDARREEQAETRTVTTETQLRCSREMTTTSHRLYGHIDDTTPAPPKYIDREVKRTVVADQGAETSVGSEIRFKYETLTENNLEYEVWLAHDQSLLAYITSTLSEEVLGGVDDDLTALELWSMLATTYSQLAVIGHPVSDKDKVQQALSGLGTDFDIFCTNLEVLPVLPSFKDLKAKLFQHEASRVQRHNLIPSNSYNVPITGTHALQGNRPSLDFSGRNGKRYSPKATFVTLNDKNEVYDTWLHAEILRQRAEMLPEQKEQVVNEPETLVNSSLDNTTSLDSLPSTSQPNDPSIDNHFSGLVYSRRSVSTAAPRQSQRVNVIIVIKDCRAGYADSTFASINFYFILSSQSFLFSSGETRISEDSYNNDKGKNRRTRQSWGDWATVGGALLTENLKQNQRARLWRR
ncbi:hypothetical protein EJ110_NYTH34288 [Nymphaea thermarum]|nr:hypothetical protein EJ110_NYTH34288 [Nymphaea thermarum]